METSYGKLRVNDKKLYLSIMKYGDNFLFHNKDVALSKRFLEIFGYCYLSEKTQNELCLCNDGSCLCKYYAGQRKNPIEHFNSINKNPMNFHTLQGNIDIVKLFIDFDKKLTDMPDLSGVTPLKLSSAIGYYKIVKLLIKSGANINAELGTNKMPIFYAILHPKTTKLLLDSDYDHEALIKHFDFITGHRKQYDECKNMIIENAKNRKTQKNHQNS